MLKHQKFYYVSYQKPWNENSDRDRSAEINNSDHFVELPPKVSPQSHQSVSRLH